MYILTWPAAAEGGPERAGGKGWNLGRLARYGFPVPFGGVISAEGYRLFMDQTEIQELVRDLEGLAAPFIDTPDVLAKLERLRSLIEQTPLPAAVAGELHAFLAEHDLLDRPVAVRSSATAEDSAQASFAGIHSSFLNITGLAEIVSAVKRCYASLWTPQAVAYRRHMNLPDESVAAAVVILAMVDAKAAGVAFSCDPATGRLERFTISASLGLGEAVVSGTVEPDEYEVDVLQYPPVVTRRRIGRKAAMTVAAEDGGVRLAEVDSEAAARPALTDAQIWELAYLVGRVQDSLGEMVTPQDVEWAHDGHRFWLLQARPVTKLPLASFPEIAEQPVYWSNANLKDVMPGVQSTMGWSFLRSGMETLLATPLLSSGYDYRGGITWVRLVGGRPYFNLSALQWAMYDAIGISPAELNAQMGGHQPAIAVPPAPLPERAKRYVRRIRMVRQALKVMGEIPQDFERLWDWTERQLQSDFTTWPKQRFVEISLETKRMMEEFLPRFQIINSAAAGTHQELINRLSPIFGERAPGLANAMLAGASKATSAEQGERLIALANLALQEPKTRAFFETAYFAPQTWAERLEGTRFKTEFERYLKDYGHRGVYELEILNPRWAEDPTYLLETVRGQVQSGKELHLEDRTLKRNAALGEVFDRLGVRPRALQIRYFLKQAARAAELREMAKSMVVKVMSVSRAVALEVGRRLVAEGLLDDVHDVFHLSWLDMEAYLLDRPGAAGFRSLVADRKELRSAHLAAEPPDVIIGETPVKKAPPPEATGPVLSGLGVATGRAAGVARVIRHPHEGTRLQPGEVLVAPSTDPAWTPLFLRASAVVMEVGGYLSHGAIVAREYGLPAVVNIPGLLQTVQDGEPLTVDGDEGKVYRGG